MSDASAVINNEANNTKQKHWATWILDIVVAIGAISQIGIGVVLIYQLKAYEASNSLTRDALALTRKTVDAANTPWIDANISAVTSRSGDRFDAENDLPPVNGVLGITDSKGRVFKNTIEVSYSLQNHSESATPRIYSECFLTNIRGAFDRELDDTNDRALMPHQTVNLRASFLTANGDPKAVVNQINDAKIGIRVYVLFYNTMGKKSSVVETFYKIEGKFVVTNTEFDPPETEIKKWTEEAIYPAPKTP
jgi:hypothetical protein